LKEIDAATFDVLRGYALSVFQCDPQSIHGPTHWKKVEETAMTIAPQTGADMDICRLFAIFHDCCRLDDDADPDHGPRAAKLVRSILGTILPLDPTRGEVLAYAIEHHTAGRTSKDPTIGTCWDADRLDLGRVGMVPDARRMSTSAGRQHRQQKDFLNSMSNL
jgi:uncharacterized protein